MLPIGGPAAPAELAQVSMTPLVAMIALAVIATGIATVVFLKLVTVAGPSFTSFINYLIPVWALMMGVVFLGEQPGLGAILALVLILSGVGLSELGNRRMVHGEARQSA
jgi:drug/metabolite transporter (DMT)-like permease